MKYLLLLMLLFMLGCNGCDSEAYELQNAGCTWTYQHEYDQKVVGFIIYHWCGPEETYDMSGPQDSIHWSMQNMDSIGFVPYDYATGDTLFEYRPFPFYDAYARAGAVAVDDSGRKSQMELSPFVSYWSLYGPEGVEQVEVVK